MKHTFSHTTHFSSLLKQYRSQNHLTQEELASRLCISRRSLSAWENGAKLPSWNMILRVARLMDVSCDDLMCPTLYQN